MSTDCSCFLLGFVEDLSRVSGIRLAEFTVKQNILVILVDINLSELDIHVVGECVSTDAVQRNEARCAEAVTCLAPIKGKSPLRRNDLLFVRRALLEMLLSV